jgi:3-deoxy-D-manno-octulosonic acid (KDO) 8-phosphate synthase
MPSKVIETRYRKVKKVKIGGGDGIILIGGYCTIQSSNYALMIENYTGENCEKLGIDHFGNSDVVGECNSAPNFSKAMGSKTVRKSLPRFDTKYSVKVVIPKCF